VTPFQHAIVIVGLVGGFAGCASATAPVVVPGAAEATIPRGAVRILEQRWGPIELGSSMSATCPGVSGAPATLVRGDFNGDGVEDFAVWVTAGGTPRLAALFARLDGEHLLAEVGEGRPAGPVMLEVARRGTAYTSPTVESFYGVDTLVLRGCDGTRTAWFWTGASFQPQTVAN
jgi:hypothetical protein